MKSLLAVSWWFPPLLGPRSIQVAKSLHTLEERGWEISVLTTGLSHLPLGIAQDPALLEKYCQELQIERIASPWLTPLRQVVGKLLLSQPPLPDPQIYWAKKAQREILADFNCEGFDALISFGQPWSVHVLAKAMAEKNGLPWLAHFSDPWADNPYNQLDEVQAQKMKALEQDTVLAAQSLVFTNQPTLDLVMEKYSKSERKKTHVVPHGFDPKLLDSLPSTSFNKDPGKLTFLHVGNIYGIRNPGPLIRALEHLRSSPEVFADLDFAFVGLISQKARWQSEIAKKGLQNAIRFEKRVSYFESLAIAKQADVLLTLDAASDAVSVFLPSKLVEYLALDKPILGITPEEGVSADLLSSIGMPHADPQRPKEIAEAIRGLHTQWKQGKLEFDHRQSKAAMAYGIEATTDRLEQALLEIID